MQAVCAAVTGTTLDVAPLARRAVARVRMSPAVLQAAHAAAVYAAPEARVRLLATAQPTPQAAKAG
jgi:hypothetical protein